MQSIESKIAKRLIRQFLDAGYSLGVNDGEETTLARCADADVVFKALATTDMDYLRVYSDGDRIGSVLLVWGNGEDLIRRYTDTPKINAICNRFV